MMLSRRTVAVHTLALLVTAGLAQGCNSGPLPFEYNKVSQLVVCGEVPECDQAVTVAADSQALLVTDAKALSALPIEDVLDRLISANGGAVDLTPLQLLQRMFDTNNDSATGQFEGATHCDSGDNVAHANGPAASCPRPEGALAKSDGLLEPGHPDHFMPVAVVNRIDLTTVAGGSCGEYRIVYAKESGLEDPDDRVFIIFEANLPNPEPGCLLGCRPVAEFWKGLESEKDPAVLGEKLRSFFLDGLPGFTPLITAENLGLGSSGGYNGGVTGQVRLSQHMGADWELRQFSAGFDFGGTFGLQPVLVGNNPFPEYFEPMPEGSAGAHDLYIDELVFTNVPALATSSIPRMSATTSLSFLSGESALGGEAVNDYVSRAQGNEALLEALQTRIDQSGLSADCPVDDPLTAESIVRRATVQSCAGCHAPTQLLGPERKLGCGLVFPDTLGEVQIDERGNLSPALTEVFLPHRAEVLTAYLQACNEDEILQHFTTAAQGEVGTRSARPRTLGGSTTH